MLIETALKYLKDFYSNIDGDFSSLKDIYVNSGLDLSETKKNRKWLSNKQAHLIGHGLVTAKYKGRALSGLVLTEKGRAYIRELGNGQQYAQVPNLPHGDRISHSKLTLEEIMKAMPKLKEENPEFDITFNVSLKNKG